MKGLIFILTTSIILGCSPDSENIFSIDYEFNINFFSANREELILDSKQLQSLSGQYNYSTEIYTKRSLQKDSIKIFNFIETAKHKILNGEKAIHKYGYSPYSVPYIVPVEKEKIESYFFRCDTEFIENKNGDLHPLPIHDTVQYSDAKRLDLTQEWFYNYETNEIEIQNICYSFAIAKYDELNNYKGLMPMYIIKQGEFSSLKNQKERTKNKKTVWAQRIKLTVPLTDFLKDYPGRKESQPIKSVNNSQIGKILFNKVKDGELNAYKPNSNDIYSNQELDSLIKSRVDTEFIESEFGDIEPRIIIEEYTAEEVGPIGIKQKLIFDPKSLRIDSEIKSVMISITLWDVYGEFSGYKDLFKIKFE